MDRMSERLRKLRQLYDQDASDPFLTYGIAMEHAKEGRVQDAIDWLDRTLENDPAYCYAYYHKARLLAEAGQISPALDALRQGLEVAIKQSDGKAQSEMTELLVSLED